MNTLREFEFWTPSPIFAGETVFLLASGPSLTAATVERLRGRRVMAINMTAPTLAPWCDCWFFTDTNIFADNRAFVDAFAGEIVTLSRAAKREMPDRIKRVRGEWMPGFPPCGAEMIRQGRSSGHTAISALVALGARRIVLLGYDMRLVDGREHHHDAYAGRPRDLDIYAREFAPGFAGWNAAAKAVGVEVLNATPGSAVTEFPFVELDALLRERILEPA